MGGGFPIGPALALYGWVWPSLFGALLAGESLESEV